MNEAPRGSVEPGHGAATGTDRDGGSPPPPRRPRRSPSRGLRRLALALAIGIGAFLGLRAFVETALFEDLARRQLISRASALLGEDVHVAALSLDVREGRVELGGIEVHSRDPRRPGQLVLAAERVVVDLRWAGFVPRLVLEHVVVDRPRLRLRVEEGRVVDLLGLQEALSRPRGTSRLKVVLRRLEVHRGEVGVRVAPEDLEALAAGLEVDLALVPDGSGVGTVVVDRLDLEGPGFRERFAVHSGRVTLDPRRVQLEGYRIDTTLGPLAVDATISLGGKAGKGPEAAPPAASLSLRGDLDLAKLPGVLRKDPKTRGSARFSVEASTSPAGPSLTAHVAARGIEVGRIVVGDAELRARYTGESVEVTDLRADYGGGRVTGTARVGLRGELPVEVALDLSGVRLERVLNNNAVQRVWVMMVVDGEIAGRGRLKDGFKLDLRADLRPRDFRVLNGDWQVWKDGRPVLRLDRVSVRTGVLVLPDRVSLPDARIQTDRSDLQASVDFLFGKPLGLDIRAVGTRFDWADLGGVAGLRFAGTGRIRADIVGKVKDLDISGHGDFDTLRFERMDLGKASADVRWHPGGGLRIGPVQAQRGGSPYSGSLDVHFGRKGAPTRLDGQVAFEGARAADLAGILFDDVGLDGRATGSARFSGPVRSYEGEGRLRIEDAVFFGERWSSLEATGRARDGIATFDEVWLRKGDAGVFGRGTLATDGRVDLHGFTYGLDVSELDAAARTGLPFTGEVMARARLGGTVREPRATVDVELPALAYRRSPVGASRLRLRLADRTLGVEGTLLGGALRIADTSLDLSGEGAWKLAVAVDHLPLDPYLPEATRARGPVSFIASGTVAGSGSRAVPGGADVRVTLPELAFRREDLAASAPEPIRVRVHGGRVEVESARLEGANTDLRLSGTAVPGGALALDLEGRFDLRLVDVFAPVFERIEAEAAEVSVAVRGDWGSPGVTGRVVLDEAALRTRFFPATLEIADAAITLADRRLRFERHALGRAGSGPGPYRFQARLGGGDVVVHRAEIELDGFRPRRYDLAVDCLGCTVRYPSFLPPTTADARLTFTGTVPDLVLGGIVEVADMTLRDPIDWQASTLFQRGRREYTSRRAAGSPLFRFDLRLVSPDGLRLNNNFGTARASADLKVVGDTSRVGIVGGGVALEGQIRWKGHEFALSEGNYRFEDPYSLDPSFDLVLETRVETPDQDYDVTYEMAGTLSDYTFTPWSDPALSEADINSLLLFGVTGANLLAADAGVGDAVGTIGAQAASLVGGAFGELLVGAYKGNLDPRLESVLPDQIEVVPVYSATGQAAATRLVLSKELVRDRLQGQVGLNVFGKDALTAVTLRGDLRIFRGFYLVGTWSFGEDDPLLSDLPFQPGNGSLDFRVRLEGG